MQDSVRLKWMEHVQQTMPPRVDQQSVYVYFRVYKTRYKSKGEIDFSRVIKSVQNAALCSEKKEIICFDAPPVVTSQVLPTRILVPSVLDFSV
jgi:hypothetical protein